MATLELPHIPVVRSPASGSSSAAPGRLETVLTVCLLMSIALVFWSAQRYPALLKKLHTGGAIKVSGALSFDALLPPRPQAPLPERVGRTTVNWLWTNRFGMYFAIPFGAAAMTLLAGSTRPKRFGSASANVLCGAVAGAPMGVCTNCATPIGQSLLLGGASSRLTVAAMISSPSFNPVVVAMAFVLFPMPLALLRLAVSAALLLLVPWLVPENQPTFKTVNVNFAAKPSAGKRLSAWLIAYLRNVLRVAWVTLPWMLLAALLGALMVELVPAYGTHLHAGYLALAVVAVLGTLLPVPMALDVALAFVLYRAGAPPAIVAVLLCTLGPVSVYSLSALASCLAVRLLSVLLLQRRCWDSSLVCWSCTCFNQHRPTSIPDRAAQRVGPARSAPTACLITACRGPQIRIRCANVPRFVLLPARIFSQPFASTKCGILHNAEEVRPYGSVLIRP